MLVCFWSQPDFLYLDFCLRFAGFAFFLGPFVKELSEIHYPANWGGGACSYFDQIQVRSTGDLQGLIDRHNAYILSIWTN